jgi:signal peptidase II
VIVAILVALDLWSKSAVFAWLLPQPPEMVPDAHGHLRYPILGEWFTFYLSWNPGMAWGVTVLPPWLLVGGRVAAVCFLAWLLARVPRAKRVLVTALVLILAGAVGNLYDNLFLEPRTPGATFGEVRDFIDVYFAFRDWHFPTFNVADSCITVGAVLLFGSSFFGKEDEE